MNFSNLNYNVLIYYFKLWERRRPYIYQFWIFFSRSYFLIKGPMFNDFCNSFQAQQTFSSLINFVCVFNIKLHILFCRIFFYCGNSSRFKFSSVKALHLFILSIFSSPTCILFAKFSMPYIYSRPYVYSFWQIFQALCLFPVHFYSGVQSRYDKPFRTSKKNHSVINNCSDLSLFE